jgi:hypothetical protein
MTSSAVPFGLPLGCSMIHRRIGFTRNRSIFFISLIFFLVVSTILQALRPLFLPLFDSHNYTSLWVKLSDEEHKKFTFLPLFDSHNYTSLWIKLSDEEHKNFTSSDRMSNDPCNRPFKHCCIGQCRQEIYALDERDAMYKFNGSSTPLATFSDVLDYYYDHHHVQKQEKTKQDGLKKESCNILFIGDSLSSDHAMGATCHLLGSGYNLTSCNNAYGGAFGDQYGSDRHVTCKTNLYPNLSHHTLEKKDATSCPKINIGFLWMDNNTADVIREAREIHEEGGLIVFNWGAWCNKKNENCIISTLSSSILPMLRGGKSTLYNQWKFFYREMEPQHFPGPGGLYPVDKHKQVKKSSSAFCYAEEVDNWRNEEVQQFMSLHNLTQEIPTIEIFRSLSTLYQLHYSRDCTHYCYNPLRLDVTWDGILKALTH